MISEDRGGDIYTYSYNAANRLKAVRLNGALQAQYKYNALGQQVWRKLHPSGQIIHSIFDLDGNRIAEYDYAGGSSTLIREYIWMNGLPVAVVEGGVVYYVRTDHIGRPVFATDSAGVKVWEASYLPFGEVLTTTGTPMELWFPGQWFQAESGLHQNWMRDYDPTTGRYLQADPLGLVDGASVYGYARQNPGRYVDPTGEFTIMDARVSSGSGGHSLDQIFDEWLRLERENTGWLNELTPCPCKMADRDSSKWGNPEPADQRYHPGGSWAMWSVSTRGMHGNQCVYDVSGNLIQSPPAAGSADLWAANGLTGIMGHVAHDVDTYSVAEGLNRISDYFSVRPVVSQCCEQ